MSTAQPQQYPEPPERFKGPQDCPQWDGLEEVAIRSIQTICARLGSSQAPTEDLISETFIRAKQTYQKRLNAELARKPIESFVGWLSLFLTRTALDARRSMLGTRSYTFAEFTENIAPVIEESYERKSVVELATAWGAVSP